MTPTAAKPPKGTFLLAGRTFPRVAWWKYHNMRVLYFYIAVLILSNFGNGFDGSMMNGLQSLVYWQDYFDHPHGSTLGLFGCIMSVGSLVGLLVLPFGLDRWGRKPGIVVGCVIMLLGIGLQAGATGFGMFVAARFLVGLGDVIVVTTAPLLIAEIAPVQDRAILVTLMASCYGAGSFIAAWVTYGTLVIQSDWAWRAPSLLQATFTLLVLAVIWFIPESPRFYISMDQPEKALKVLAKYHGNGNENDEVVQLEFTEISSAIAMDKAANANSSYLDFFRTPGNRKRLVILLSIGVFSQWSGNGLISYYLNIILDTIGITDSRTQLVLNGGNTTFSFVTGIAFTFIVDRLGRRPIYMISTVARLVAFVIWTILSARYTISPSSGLGTGVVVMIFLYGLAYSFQSGLISSYTTEILPYGLRAKGYSIMYIALYLALFFNQYVNPIAMDNLSWKYYIFYCCFLGFEVVVVYFFYVETRYVPLEEIAKCFDGDDHLVEVVNTELQKNEKFVSTAEEVEVV